MRRVTRGYSALMHLPEPRGELSEHLFAALATGRAAPDRIALTDDDDLQISLWALYELHYRGFDEVDPAREWDPCLIAVRAELEDPFEVALRERTAELVAAAAEESDLVAGLERIVAADGPSVARYLHRRATRDQFLEYLTLRSVYHLKETDPEVWLLPRLTGAAKAALAELAYDEFGAGHGDAVHQVLFEEALRDVGLDPAYGAYVDRAPAHVLAVNNAMSLFGLHRRLRGASAGHFAAFEMTSSLPCRRIVQGAERLGLGPGVIRYYSEHVEADAVHEHVASRSLCGSMVAEDPALRADIFFGAATCIALEADSSARTLEAWDGGATALRPLHAAPAA